MKSRNLSKDSEIDFLYETSTYQHSCRKYCSVKRAIFQTNSHFKTYYLMNNNNYKYTGGLNILHVKQYLSFTTCPQTTTSLVRGGGR